jgi:hypothetical protein
MDTYYVNKNEKKMVTMKCIGILVKVYPRKRTWKVLGRFQLVRRL